MFKRCISLLVLFSVFMSLTIFALASYEELSLSEDGIEFLKEAEGFESKPYTDGTGWYIGYGNACSPGDYPDGISQEAAEQLLVKTAENFAASVNAFLKRHDLSVTQNEFDALCCLTYNLGAAWLSDSDSLAKIVIAGAGNYTENEVASAFASWCHVGSAVYEPLLERRIAEAKMFLYADYGSGSDRDFVYIVFDAGEGRINGDVRCYLKGGAYGELPAASRDGYTLSHWETESGERLSAEGTAREDLYVSAVWQSGESEAPVSSFPDVTQANWYYGYVTYLASQGVISGFTDGCFHPQEELSYGQALKLVLLAAAHPVQPEDGDGHWAQAYLDYAIAGDFVSEGEIADLNASISRFEIAAIAAKALSMGTPDVTGVFADTDDESVLALYEAGIVEGSLDAGGHRIYKGGDCITRAEISAVIYRIAGYVENPESVEALRQVDDSPALHSYDTSLLSWSGGRVGYGGNIKTLTGIDVSYYQGEVDWDAVAADGIDFAFIRAGYRGNSGGTLNEDECFRANVLGATGAGIATGVYFFSQATTEAEAIEEANYVLSLISGYDVSWPVVFDWETVSGKGWRTEKVESAMLAKCAIAFCDTVKAAGYTPMIYMNRTLAASKYDLKAVEKYDVWLADYYKGVEHITDYAYDYQIWQYTSSGSVKGISGRVDMNLSFKDYGAG